MLFNSYEFLLVFLPLALLGYFMLGAKSPPLGAGWLALASLGFYGWWNVAYLPLLMASIVGNYFFGAAIARNQGSRRAGQLLFIALALNLSLLIWYKYVGFFVASTNKLAGTSWIVPQIMLPLGISFFTFTQIAFLVDAWVGKVKETRFVHYVLFVSYFPHLIAGPVLHHSEMMPQFDARRNYRLRLNNVLIGGSIFVFGLAKKVLLADNLAPYAVSVFDRTQDPSLLVAWGGVLAYTFQLYFDFSGYSDMAIGLSRLFGVRLPLNFNSPYKSVNIVEFWRRWHMTLSRFLRDYLYFPLGGNRHGRMRRYSNLMTTMLLGGLWHGAGWNFVLWGGLHGFYLCVNHAWSAMAGHIKLPKVVAVALTFLAVVFAWVFFRAENFTVARSLILGMLGGHGIGLPDAIGLRLGGIKPMLESLGVKFFLGGGSQFLLNWTWVIVAALVAFSLPNTQEWHARFGPALEAVTVGSQRWRWSLRPIWAIGLGLATAVSVLSLSRPSEFLYFQF